MPKKKKKEQKEITSFSGELMDFNLGDINIEELDRRLELAIAQLSTTTNILTCKTNCGSYCAVFNCDLNVGGILT